MWMTGFDVPSCSTIYLDKPLRNHTLMQTIARANRVFGDKVNGLIVDYVGVFRDLQKALAIYAVPTVDGDGAMPVRDKGQLLEWLQSAVEEARTFCVGIGVDLGAVAQTSGLATTAWKDDSVEKIVVDEETKSAFMAHARIVNQLFKAILPDSDANQFIPVASALRFLADSVNSLAEPVDVSRVLDRVQELLDESVATTPYIIRERPGGYAEAANGDRRVDLNSIDWDAVAKRFQSGRKRTEIERLRAAIKAKVEELARLNPNEGGVARAAAGADRRIQCRQHEFRGDVRAATAVYARAGGGRAANAGGRSRRGTAGGLRPSDAS